MADRGKKAPVVRRRRTPRTPRASKPTEAKTRPSTAMEEARAAMEKARATAVTPEPVETIRPKDLRELLSPTGPPTPEELQDAKDAALRSRKRARQRALRG